MSTSRRLTVYRNSRPVGTLWADSARLQFAYHEEVLGDRSAALGVRLPVRPGTFDDHLVRPCFENLLPEGDLRAYLAKVEKVDVGDVVGLLAAFGGECSGALSLWPEGDTPPSQAAYAPCDVHDVRAALAMVRANEASVRPSPAQVMQRGRLSMSGAQDKLVLFRRPSSGPGSAPDEPVYRVPLRGAPSTVLVKHAREERFPGLLHNELLCMRLMAAAGVPTAQSAVHALDATVYETARFDRLLEANEAVTRLHAEDGCQVTGRTSFQKYASTGAPGYAELCTVLRRAGAAPAEDAERLLRWAVANLALGNRDAHAKNLMLLHTASGVRLAPAYDVTCTLVYPDLDADELPLRFGGQTHVKGVNAQALRVAAREFGVTPARAAAVASDACDRLLAAIDGAAHTVVVMAGAHRLVGELCETVRAAARETRERLVAVG
ncbi:MAG: HipA domain-containing protein [Gemmatimonadaceae bacterium]|nr:HipA domain-containing protein [Gemmatimonadaceae bacterium]